MPNTKTDRTLALVATPTLIWRADGGIGASMTYQQTESVPNMPNAVDRQTGNINLNRMPPNPRYTDNIDVYIFLDASACVDRDGNPVTVRWALQTESSPPSVGGIWFCKTPAPGQPKDTTPISVPNMSVGRVSDELVWINDNQPVGGGDYTYCTAIVLPDYGNYYITMDPVISDKGVSRPPAAAEPI